MASKKLASIAAAAAAAACALLFAGCASTIKDDAGGLPIQSNLSLPPSASGADGNPNWEIRRAAIDGMNKKDAWIIGGTGIEIYPRGGYITADWERVLWMKPDGTIRVLAGTPSSSSGGGQCDIPTDPCGDGGPARSAKLSAAHDVAPYGTDGSFVIADTFDNRVRMVDAAGNISTIAGTGLRCPDGTNCGGSENAKLVNLELPSAVSVSLDQQSIYVTTTARIWELRKRPTGGWLIRNFAGTGTAGWDSQVKVATDAPIRASDAQVSPWDNKVYIADGRNCVLRRVESDQKLWRVAGDPCNDQFRQLPEASSGNNGPARNAKFGWLGQISFNTRGAIYVADQWNCTIRTVLPDTTDGAATVSLTVGPDGETDFSKQCGHSTDNSSPIARIPQLWLPNQGTWFTSSNGTEYMLITDVGNRRVRLVYLRGDGGNAFARRAKDTQQTQQKLPTSQEVLSHAKPAFPYPDPRRKISRPPTPRSSILVAKVTRSGDGVNVRLLCGFDDFDRPCKGSVKVESATRRLLGRANYEPLLPSSRATVHVSLRDVPARVAVRTSTLTGGTKVWSLPWRFSLNP